MNQFLSGATMSAFVVAAMFFLKAWRTTRDRLFFLFAIAFWLMAAERVAFSVLRLVGEQELKVYVIRLVAFTILAIAILDKNRRADAAAPAEL